MLTTGAVLTHEGQNLEVRSKVELKEIEFLYFKIGDGDVVTIDEIKNLTDIAGVEIIRTNVSLVSKKDNSTYLISGMYDNEGGTEEKQIREYGLFAKLVGDTAPVLYSYLGLGEGMVMPPDTGMNWIQSFEFLTVVTQDTTVMITYDPSALVDMDTFVTSLATKVDVAQIVQEPLNKETDKILSATASNVSFENGVGAAVMGYIEDGTQHNVGEVWISRTTKGEFKCKVANTDTVINAANWVQIDDLTNATKLENLNKFVKSWTTTSGKADLLIREYTTFCEFSITIFNADIVPQENIAINYPAGFTLANRTEPLRMQPVSCSNGLSGLETVVEATKVTVRNGNMTLQKPSYIGFVVNKIF